MCLIPAGLIPWEGGPVWGECSGQGFSPPARVGTPCAPAWFDALEIMTGLGPDRDTWLFPQGDLKQFLRISKSKDEKLKSQPLSTKQKVRTGGRGPQGGPGARAVI